MTSTTTKPRPGFVPAIIVLVALAPLFLLLLLLAAATPAASAAGQLSVMLEPLKDSPEPKTVKYLASAVSGGWGEPPLGPGTVAFSFERESSVSSPPLPLSPSLPSSSSSAGDVHLGLAQATLLLPCGTKGGKVKAAFTPTGAKEATSFGAKAVEVSGC